MGYYINSDELLMLMFSDTFKTRIGHFFNSFTFDCDFDITNLEIRNLPKTAPDATVTYLGIYRDEHKNLKHLGHGPIIFNDAHYYGVYRCFYDRPYKDFNKYTLNIVGKNYHSFTYHSNLDLVTNVLCANIFDLSSYSKKYGYETRVLNKNVEVSYNNLVFEYGVGSFKINQGTEKDFIDFCMILQDDERCWR